MNHKFQQHWQLPTQTPQFLLQGTYFFSQQVPRHIIHSKLNKDNEKFIDLQHHNLMINNKKIETLEFQKKKIMASQFLKDKGLESLIRFLDVKTIENVNNKLFSNVNGKANITRERPKKIHKTLPRQHKSSFIFEENSSFSSSDTLRQHSSLPNILKSKKVKGRPRYIHEPEQLCGVKKTCLKCSSAENQFQYFNNNSISQPRYKCLHCSKLFTYYES